MWCSQGVFITEAQFLHGNVKSMKSRMLLITNEILCAEAVASDQYGRTAIEKFRLL